MPYEWKYCDISTEKNPANQCNQYKPEIDSHMYRNLVYDWVDVTEVCRKEGY